jgi:hypothetical protein
MILFAQKHERPTNSTSAATPSPVRGSFEAHSFVDDPEVPLEGSQRRAEVFRAGGDIVKNPASCGSLCSAR